MEIETTVLQAMSYCFYEILDNVLTHSGKELGTVITHYDSVEHVLSFLVADDGIGVRASLSENEEYAQITEPEALKMCIKDVITDGKGMGFGLYSTSLLARDAGLRCAPAIMLYWCRMVLSRLLRAAYGRVPWSICSFAPIEKLIRQKLLPIALM